MPVRFPNDITLRQTRTSQNLNVALCIEKSVNLESCEIGIWHFKI